MSKGKSWSKKEKEFLKENYGKVSHGEIAKHLNNRTPNAVGLMALKFGLTRTSNKSKPITVEEETDWAYIAGFLDGDGGIYPRLPYVMFDSTNKEIIEWLKQILGAPSIYVRDPKDRKNLMPHGIKTRKIAYRIEIGKQSNVKQILERTMPYLKIKKDRAIKALDNLKKRQRL